ncbi:MAG: cysteine hydrolase [Clostridia bacterium]|nr:cysteine hydrolase [Clostridia bacterium]
MVLLVVDTQQLITTENLYAFDQFVTNVKTIIHQARAHQIELIYVRHDDGEGSELTKGKAGFEIYEAFQPLADEKIFDKRVNSAFKDTGLLDYLKSLGEKEIVMVGLQTDYCMDATVKCGFEHGFNIIIPAYSNTTVDNDFMTAEQGYRYYNEMMWHGRYASCLPMETVLKRMQG